MLAIPIFLPLISGFVLFLLATAGHKWQEGITKKLSVAVMGIVLLTAVFHGINLYGKSPAVTIWKLKEDIPLLLHLDDLGTVFSTLVVFVWILITLYTFSYMKGDKKGARFLGCHLMTLGMLMGITSAGNLVTMYLFYAGDDRLRDSCADERSNRRRIQICILFDRRCLFGTDRVLLHLPVDTVDCLYPGWKFHACSDCGA